MVSENPFLPSFGRKPYSYIERYSQTEEIITNFNSKHGNYVYMITGVRGSGKTVLMTEISNKLNEQENWEVFELNPEEDLLKSLCAKLYNNLNFTKYFIDAKLNLSFFGIGINFEKSVPVTDIDTAVQRMFEILKKKNRRVLVSIDEVTPNDNIRKFCHAFQIYIRKELPIYLLMTGLFDNIQNLKNEKNLTFLYRAPKIVLSNLDPYKIKERYKQILEVSEDDAVKMAKLTKGYPYAYQLLGNYYWKEKNIDRAVFYFDEVLADSVYDKIYSELSENDKKVLNVMDDGPTKTSTVLERTGFSKEKFSVYRDRLGKKGIINIKTRGQISFTLPRFYEYLKRKFEF